MVEMVEKCGKIMVRTKHELCWACMAAMFDEGMEEVAALREHLRAVVEQTIRRRLYTRPSSRPA